MKTVFAPGCALLIYKPGLADRAQAALERELGPLDRHLTCCRHEPGLPPGTRVINVCPGCDRRYRQLYEGISTISLWELLAESRVFPFPDHGGQAMAVLDACPTRDQERVHEAVRTLLRRMNVRAVEPERTRTQGTCCGDTFYPALPAEDVKRQMRKRAGEMPCEDVVVYCVSCTKAMHVGGRRPRYLVDLLFGEDTPPGTIEPDAWHAQVDAFIEAH
ncbi:MAG: (Fe-S)-binding protein [Acidobacteria bacterium]|nr:(Fe-S)-binding protein [Acidobacteriota bacterium]